MKDDSPAGRPDCKEWMTQIAQWVLVVPAFASLSASPAPGPDNTHLINPSLP